MIAIDGKTVRRSHDCAKGRTALHLVTATQWADDWVVTCRTQAHSPRIQGPRLLIDGGDGAAITAFAKRAKLKIDVLPAPASWRRTLERQARRWRSDALDRYQHELP